MTNLLNKAKNFSVTGTKVEINFARESVEIANLSNQALPGDPFRLGEKGAQSTGCGYGLFMAKNIFTPLIGCDILPSSKKQGNVYKIGLKLAVVQNK